MAYPKKVGLETSNNIHVSLIIEKTTSGTSTVNGTMKKKCANPTLFVLPHFSSNVLLK